MNLQNKIFDIKCLLTPIDEYYDIFEKAFQKQKEQDEKLLIKTIKELNKLLKPKSIIKKPNNRLRLLHLLTKDYHSLNPDKSYKECLKIVRLNMKKK